MFGLSLFMTGTGPNGQRRVLAVTRVCEGTRAQIEDRAAGLDEAAVQAATTETGVPNARTLRVGVKTGFSNARTLRVEVKAWVDAG
jgi:hypothetical protein